ncbi:MAG: asparagine--tRNA ligase [Candidatus Asgardarchaeia archaeon]
MTMQESDEKVLRGWVFKKREHKKIIFIDLRTKDGIIQCVINKEKVSPDVWETADELTQESCIEVSGSIVEQPKAPGGRELQVNKIKVYHIAESPYPLGKKEHSPDVLLRYRHLALRSPRYQAIMKIRSIVMNAAREFFIKNGWYEISPPILTFTAVEGGATLFKVKYFDSEAYLSQSAQLYLEVMIFSLEKVWSLTPSFRAEKSRTPRHLTEYWHLEAEAAWMDMNQLMELEENLVTYMTQKAIEQASEYLEFLGVNIDDLKKVRPPFKRISYDKAIDILQSQGFDIVWGEDLGADEERALTQNSKEPLFVYGYPLEIKAFYVQADPKNPKVGLTADLLAPEGYGEITTGGQREINIDRLIERIKKEGFDPESYWWYLDLRRYGSVYHSGFGLGIERYLRWLLKLDHIREAIPFPRMARREEYTL